MIFRLTILLSLILVTLAPLQAHEKPTRTFTETKVMSDETRLVVQLLENVHYKNESMEQEAFETLLTNFMAQLDTHRLFFLDSDLNFLPQDLRQHTGRGSEGKRQSGSTLPDLCDLPCSRGPEGGMDSPAARRPLRFPRRWVPSCPANTVRGD